MIYTRVTRITVTVAWCCIVSRDLPRDLFGSRDLPREMSRDLTDLVRRISVTERQQQMMIGRIGKARSTPARVI